MSRARLRHHPRPGSGSYGVLQSWLYYDRVLPLGGLAGALLLLVTGAGR